MLICAWPGDTEDWKKIWGKNGLKQNTSIFVDGTWFGAFAVATCQRSCQHATAPNTRAHITVWREPHPLRTPRDTYAVTAGEKGELKIIIPKKKKTLGKYRIIVLEAWEKCLFGSKDLKEHGLKVCKYWECVLNVYKFIVFLYYSQSHYMYICGNYKSQRKHNSLLTI